MRICYLADAQSIHTQRWCSHFASLGHEVHLITFRNAKIDNVNVHFIDAGAISVKGNNWRILIKISAVKKLVMKINPDILHAHYATSYGYAGARTGFHPYVITAHGSDVLLSPSSSLLYRILVRYALSRADWITAVAQHIEYKITKLGIDEKKVDTLYLGINPSVFNTINRRVSTSEFQITSTRNFESIYNIPVLIDAVKRVISKIPHLRVNLIGGGTQLEQLKKQVNHAKLNSVIHFLGILKQHEVSDVLKKSHIFINPSSSDGTSISLIEAMACGCILIASDIAANRPWIYNGENGFLFPYYDSKILAEKILYVYEHYHSMAEQTLKINNNMIQEKCIWDKNMKMIEAKYRELIRK